MKTVSLLSILLIGLLIIRAVPALCDDPQPQALGPSIDHLEKTFVELKLWKIQFASGLKATDDGGPNGLGTEIVYNATKESGYASGFVLRPDGTIATNFHVARRCRRAEATFPDGTTLDIDSLEAYDRHNDLALLKMTSDKTLTTVELDNSDVRVYDRVYSVGNPMGGGMSVTEGMVNRVHKDEDGTPICIQHSAAIAPGNSGGPLYRAGKVVGVNSSSLPPYEIHFAVPVSRLSQLMESPNRPSALEDWFPSNPAEIIKKSRLIDAVTDELPAAGDEPTAISYPVDLWNPLMDLFLEVNADGNSDLQIVVRNEYGELIGFADSRDTAIEDLFFSVEEPSTIIIHVVNYADSPAKYGLQVHEIVW